MTFEAIVNYDHNYIYCVALSYSPYDFLSKCLFCCGLECTVQGATTFNITTFSIMTLRIMTLSMKGLIVKLSINDRQLKWNSKLMTLSITFHKKCHYAECHYTECHYAQCCSAYLNAQLLNLFKPLLMQWHLMMLLIIRFQVISSKLRRCHDTKHNDIQHNST